VRLAFFYFLFFGLKRAGGSAPATPLPGSSRYPRQMARIIKIESEPDIEAVEVESESVSADLFHPLLACHSERLDTPRLAALAAFKWLDAESGEAGMYDSK